mmetsp:Transcript_8546/g.12958  ORF Transcript_8546/g.12958 Transcript_8546/m.12958 type:complete len:88 (-) Transcript_8546:118-381(-)|eukprot:CAMPEP_0201509100 /NCGR_PEP_ID=MMETSP0161_2-20130828/2251_1 /ASSEMBLY_ACC=CAM_ASM_000251 /TAXON_ID=180227 /ORGANISM="Neoparamoeba aestuarina, Strain SoJaBio B1-5/56/2" /LENGTH=87 /DNA_ID=CAMNT_0047903953 /DNA_START=67 /DNA_END=330 /DNA_ORIENTATION=-
MSSSGAQLSITHANTKLEVIEAFRVFDVSGTGVISAQDLKAVLREMGDIPMTEPEIDELVYEADMYGDQQIRYSEFVDMLFMWSNNA